MRNFSLIGLLLALAIIAYLAKGMLAPSVSHDPSDKSTVEYWVAHNADRDAMLSYCTTHPDQQNTDDCKLAIAAQTQIDTQTVPKQPGREGVTQNSQDAADQLQAQQDANNLP